MLKVTKRHPFTDELNTLELPITVEQIRSWESGTLAQHAFPFLNPDQREFLISGILPGEWDTLMDEEE